MHFLKIIITLIFGKFVWQYGFSEGDVVGSRDKTWNILTQEISGFDYA